MLNAMAGGEQDESMEAMQARLQADAAAIQSQESESTRRHRLNVQASYHGMLAGFYPAMSSDDYWNVEVVQKNCELLMAYMVRRLLHINEIHSFTP